MDGSPVLVLLRPAEVLRRTGLQRNTIRRMEAAGTFPTKIIAGAKSVRYLEHEVNAWILSRERGGRGDCGKLTPRKKKRARLD